MRLINRKKSLKLIGLQISVIVAIFLTQAVMVFFSQNRVLVILPKNDEKSFYGLYASAKVDYLDASKELEECKAEKHQAILDSNPDLQ